MSSLEFQRNILEVLGVENQRVRKIDIHIEVRGVTTATIEFLMLDEEQGLVSVLKNYKIVEMDEEECVE